jgi:Tfp pilus assembly protein PilE
VELVVVVAFIGVLVLIGYVMYKLLDAGVAFWKARRASNRRH